MAIDFNQIPVTLRVPGVFVEIDASRAGSGIGEFPLRGLIIAQRRAGAGTVAEAVPVRVTRAEDAVEFFGAGSQAARMAAAWLLVNRSTELDVVSLDDDGGAVPASGNIQPGGVAADGAIVLYIAGQRISVSVSSSMTLDDVRTAIHNAIVDQPDLPVTSAATPGGVVLSALNAGEVGNTIDVRHSHLAGEKLPAGMTLTITPMSNGQTDPDIATALVAVADVQYDVIAHPYTAAANLATLEADLATRSSALEAIPGLAVTGATGSQGVLAALGDARNSEFSCIVGMEPFPGVPCERAASVAGLVAFHGSQNPARPFQTLGVPGFAPSRDDRFTLTERDLLLHDGISTLNVDRADAVRIERLITTYQTAPSGAPDQAFLDVNTLLGLSFLRRSWVARIATLYGRHSLADDGTPVFTGAAIVTPSTIKAESIAWYQELLEAGRVEDLAGFKAESVFERDGVDPNRLNALLAVNLVNQLRVVAAVNQFRR